MTAASMKFLIHSMAACALLTALATAQDQAPAVQPAAPADPATLASIGGTTLGANRQPLSGTMVLLVQIGTAQPGARPTATSDSSGKFSFEGVAPGRYSLMALHEGYADYDFILTRLKDPNARKGAVPQPLTIAAGQHIADLGIELAPFTGLSGRVTDEIGEPMAGVTVRPLTPGSVVNGSLRMVTGEEVETGVDGGYQIMAEPGRRWYLSFSVGRPAAAKQASPAADGRARAAGTPEPRDKPEQGYATTYFPGVGELSQAVGIDAEGRPQSGLNVRLRKTLLYHVRGKVVGSIPSDFRIVVWQESGAARPDLIDTKTQIARTDGTFDIASLSTGEWTLDLRQSGKPKSLGRRSVQVRDRDVEDVVAVIQTPADLSGSVSVIAGVRPPPQTASAPLRVRLIGLDAGKGSAEALVEGDGTFTLKDVEALRYRVEVTPPPGGYVKSVLFDGRECIDSVLDLRGGSGASALRIVVSMTAAQMAGTVANPDGGAPSPAVVTLVPDGSPGDIYRPELHLMVQTDPSGQFIVRNVVPGRYRVHAWERIAPLPMPLNEAVTFSDPGFTRLFDSLSTTVTVGENESKQVGLTFITAARMEEESRRVR